MLLSDALIKNSITDVRNVVRSIANNDFRTIAFCERSRWVGEKLENFEGPIWVLELLVRRMINMQDFDVSRKSLVLVPIQHANTDQLMLGHAVGMSSKKPD